MQNRRSIQIAGDCIGLLIFLRCDSRNSTQISLNCVYHLTFNFFFGCGGSRFRIDVAIGRPSMLGQISMKQRPKCPFCLRGEADDIIEIRCTALWSCLNANEN